VTGLDGNVEHVDGTGTPEVPLGQRHPRLAELVEHELRQRIIAGRWPPGHRLVETQVADELGVSRNPVRDAFRSLASDGFVEVEPRKGARVTVMSSEAAADLFDVRGALEALAARLAAERAPATAILRLETIVTEGTAAVDAGTLDDVPAMNTRFHIALCEASGNPQLAVMMGPLRDRIQWLYAARVRERAPHSWAEHAAIVEAIAARDGDRARRMANEHIGRAKAAFLAAPAVVSP
jgi:DNA-binding GntR family transcriptional regulator